MPPDPMRVRVILPDRVLLDEPATQVVAEASDGQFAVRPRHRDWVASLVPAVLTLRRPDGAEHRVAVNGGVLVKVGGRVDVVTPNAVAGGEGEDLGAVVMREFESLREQEATARTALSRLEAGILRQFAGGPGQRRG